MGRVFVSYRRDDTKWATRNLCDHLKKHFGTTNVFMDFDNIEPGEDFVEVIDRAVGQCDVLLAVIGPGWLDSRHSSERRRLDDPADFVRLEIATALKRRVRVIPILVDDARMPAADQLPAELSELSRRQALQYNAERSTDTAQRLIELLQRLFQGATDARPPQTDQSNETAPPAQDVRPVSDAILGIDLGTTNSVIAVAEQGVPRIIASADGQRLTPSVVAFGASNEVLVGRTARRQAAHNASHTIHSVKRIVGRRGAESEGQQARLPYRLCGSPLDYTRIRVGHREYSPAEISAFILRNLKQAAEHALGARVEKAVVTVPAYFNDAQRTATKDAGAIAGLDVVRIVNEPTAAALAYGRDRSLNGKTAVFDLGGGTLDISILELSNDDGGLLCEVLSTSGDTQLGGDDFDQALVDRLAEIFLREHGRDLRQDATARVRLREAAEAAKIELSDHDSTVINLPFISHAGNIAQHLRTTIARSDFEALVRPLLDRCRAPTLQALSDAKLAPQQIEHVLLVGGSTRMPCVRRLVRDLFRQEPLADANPDEIVALGAALQGAVLAGAERDLLLIDVTPLSLGVETQGGVSTVIVPRNSSVPTSKCETFTTASDNQKSVTIHVVQGEQALAADNRTLARFELDGFPPAPRGVPQIRVSFDIDANGVLHVSARHEQTGRECGARASLASALSNDEIARLRRELEQHRQPNSDLVETARATDACEQAEQLLRQHARESSLVEWQELDQLVRQTRHVLAQAHSANLSDTVSRLHSASQRLLRKVYGG